MRPSAVGQAREGATPSKSRTERLRRSTDPGGSGVAPSLALRLAVSAPTVSGDSFPGPSNFPPGASAEPSRRWTMPAPWTAGEPVNGRPPRLGRRRRTTSRLPHRPRGHHHDELASALAAAQPSLAVASNRGDRADARAGPGRSSCTHPWTRSLRYQRGSHAELTCLFGQTGRQCGDLEVLRSRSPDSSATSD
jgi:hypothetical protein